MLSSCAETYNVEGSTSVSSLDGSKLYLKALKNKEIKNIDSCEVVHGQFHFSGVLDTVRMATLFMDDESIMPVVLEEGAITVKLDNARQKVGGTPLNDKLYTFLDKHNQLENQMVELSHKQSQMMLDGIEEEAARAGYSVISATSHEDCKAEALAIDNFIGLHVEGIIACLAQNTTDYSHFEDINDMGIPLVFFGRTCLSDKFSSVKANGDEAAQIATQHLIDTGSKRIAFIGGPNNLDMVTRRKHGYLEALRENRIPIDRSLVICDKIDYQVALRNVTELLQGSNRPDAILAFNDIITFAAFTAIKQQKLHIPQDVALIGFTDDVHAEYVTPRLSAIVDRSQQMGQTACRLLLGNINGDKNIYRKIVPQKLVIRESSAKNNAET